MQRSRDINSRWAHILPSDHDNGEIICIYSFEKRHAQHWSQGTPAFLLHSPWEDKAPAMCCWRTESACAAWRSWENDQPVEANKGECSTPPLPGWILVRCLEEVTFFPAWQIFAELCFRFEVAALLAPCSLLLLGTCIWCTCSSSCSVGEAEQTTMGSRCVRGEWGDGKSSSSLDQAGSHVAVEYHLVRSHLGV